MKFFVHALVLTTCVSAAVFRRGNHGEDLSVLQQTVSLHNVAATAELPIGPPEKDQGSSHLENMSVEEVRLRGHRLVSLMTVIAFLCFLLGFVMALSSNKVMRSSVYSVFDSANVTIIGYSFFSVVTAVVHNLEKLFAHLNSDGTVSPTVMAILNVSLYFAYATSVLFAAALASVRFKDSPTNLAIFNAVIFWVVVLSKGSAINAAQAQLGHGCPYQTTMWTTLAVVFALTCIYILHKIKAFPRWWDDMENKVMGGIIAAAVCSLVAFLIDILLKRAHGEVPVLEKTVFNQVFALLSVLACIFCNGPLLKLQKRYEDAEAHEELKYWKGRTCQMLVSFVGVLPFFTVSTGVGLMICYSLGVPANTAMAKIVNVMTNSTLAAACILVCAFTPFLQRPDEHVQKLAGFIKAFGGFLAGSTWAGMINSAGASILDKSFFYEGTSPIFVLWAQEAFSAFLLTVHVPVYIFYLKPLIDEKKDIPEKKPSEEK